MTQLKGVIEPGLTDVLVNFKQDILATLNCVKVGKITSFDGTKRTAQVQILFQRVLPDENVKSYPLLIDCPVYTAQGGGGSLQFPIAAGDQCLLLFSDRRLDEWLQNGAEAPPGDGRMHHMSDAIAIVGLNALNSDLPVYPTDKVVLRYKNTSLELHENSIAIVGTDTIEVDADAIKLVAAGTGEVDIDTLVTIKNATTTLLTLMNDFITLLEAAQVQGPGPSVYPFTTAYIALLEAYKTQFATLLG